MEQLQLYMTEYSPLIILLLIVANLSLIGLVLVSYRINIESIRAFSSNLYVTNTLLMVKNVKVRKKFNYRRTSRVSDEQMCSEYKEDSDDEDAEGNRKVSDSLDEAARSEETSV